MKDDFLIAEWSFAVQEAHTEIDMDIKKLGNGVKQERIFGEYCY